MRYRRTNESVTIPIGLVLDDNETETDLLGAVTEPPPKREAEQRRQLPRNDVRIPVAKGGGSKGMTVCTVARGCPC